MVQRTPSVGQQQLELAHHLGLAGKRRPTFSILSNRDDRLFGSVSVSAHDTRHTTHTPQASSVRTMQWVPAGSIFSNTCTSGQTCTCFKPRRVDPAHDLHHMMHIMYARVGGYIRMSSDRVGHEGQDTDGTNGGISAHAIQSTVRKPNMHPGCWDGTRRPHKTGTHTLHAHTACAHSTMQQDALVSTREGALVVHGVDGTDFPVGSMPDTSNVYPSGLQHASCASAAGSILATRAANPRRVMVGNTARLKGPGEY